MIGIYPFAGVSENHHPLETCSDIWKWAIDLLKLGKHGKQFPVICADLFYLDNSAQNILLDKSMTYHCSVKKNWFPYIFNHLEGKVKDMDKWAAMENTKTGEIATFTWSGDPNIGKKHLMSSLMKKHPGKQPANNPPGWDVYKYMYAGCNQFNQQIGLFVWPY